MRIKINLWEGLAFFLFFVGILFGIFMEKSISLEMRESLQNYFFAENLIEHTSIAQLLQRECFNWLKLFILGVCLFGIPFLYLYSYIKGVGIGFVLAFSVLNNTWESAILTVLIAVLPKILYCLPLIIVLFIAVRTSCRMYNCFGSDLISLLFYYTVHMLLGLCVLCLCVLFQWALNFLL